jgi:hypothetical protein
MVLDHKIVLLFSNLFWFKYISEGNTGLNTYFSANPYNKNFEMQKIISCHKKTALRVLLVLARKL